MPVTTPLHLCCRTEEAPQARVSGPGRVQSQLTHEGGAVDRVWPSGWGVKPWAGPRRALASTLRVLFPRETRLLPSDTHVLLVVCGALQF